MFSWQVAPAWRIAMRGPGMLRNRCLSAAVLAAAVLLGGAGSASAAVLFYEDFSDTTLEPGSAQLNGTIDGGVISYTDTSTTARARFVDIQEFSNPVLTFSWDSVAPVSATGGADNELLFRAGIGTTNNTLSGSEFIVEAIAWRSSGGGTGGGARANFPENGNATVFTVVNNQDAELTFASPIDGTDVTLAPFQYINYVRDNNTTTNNFALLNNAGAANMTDRNSTDPGPGTMTRFGIGNSSNGHMGTFALDNVLVRDEVSFAPIPEPASLGLAAVAGLGLLARRRRLRERVAE